MTIYRKRSGGKYLWIVINYWIYFIGTTFLLNPCLASMLNNLATLDKLLKQGYDRRTLPGAYSNQASTNVSCELFIKNMGSPDPISSDYSVDIYLRQIWFDERLKHQDIKSPLNLNDLGILKAIWKPEVYFPNSRDTQFQIVTVPNMLLRIMPDGEIHYLLRLKAAFQCEMNLSNFPLDSQICYIELASFSKTNKELNLKWNGDTPIKTGRLEMSQFYLQGIKATDCIDAFHTERNYSCLLAQFFLKRSIGFHLVQSYLPTVLMVVVSWVSFWMDANSVPGRVTLGVTTLLTVSSKATNIQENLPQTSYLKAIDVWLGFCTGFVFLSLLEFILVNYKWRKEKCCSKNHHQNHGGPLHTSEDAHSKMTGMKEVEGYDRSPVVCGGKSMVELRGPAEQRIYTSQLETFLQQKFLQQKCFNNEDEDSFPNKNFFFHESNCRQDELCCLREILKSQKSAQRLDEISRVIFPIAFIIFVICYSYYYFGTKQNDTF